VRSRIEQSCCYQDPFLEALPAPGRHVVDSHFPRHCPRSSPWPRTGFFPFRPLARFFFNPPGDPLDSTVTQDQQVVIRWCLERASPLFAPPLWSFSPSKVRLGFSDFSFAITNLALFPPSFLGAFPENNSLSSPFPPLKPFPPASSLFFFASSKDSIAEYVPLGGFFESDRARAFGLLQGDVPRGTSFAGRCGAYVTAFSPSPSL